MGKGTNRPASKCRCAGRYIPCEVPTDGCTEYGAPPYFPSTTLSDFIVAISTYFLSLLFPIQLATAKTRGKEP